MGGRRSINAIMLLIYEVAGKLGVAAVFVGVGLVMFYGGIKVLYIVLKK